MRSAPVRAACAALLAYIVAMVPVAAADPIDVDPAAGYCVMAGVDSAPWTNWIVAWSCGAFPGFTGWACTGVSLVWACIGENRGGSTSTGVIIHGITLVPELA